MMLQLTVYPLSMLHYLLEADTIHTVIDSIAYRPDRAIGGNYDNILSSEMFCENISSQSPLDFKIGSEYFLPSTRFINQFGRG